MLRICCIGSCCIFIDAVDCHDVGTWMMAPKRWRKTVDLEAMIQAKESYTELNIVHAGVYCTVHEVFGARYVLGTLRFAIGFGASFFALVWIGVLECSCCPPKLLWPGNLASFACNRPPTVLSELHQTTGPRLQLCVSWSYLIKRSLIIFVRNLWNSIALKL